MSLDYSDEGLEVQLTRLNDSQIRDDSSNMNDMNTNLNRKKNTKRNHEPDKSGK